MYQASPLEYTHILGQRLFATRLLNGTINATLSTAQIRANAAGSPVVSGSSQASVYFSVYNSDTSSSSGLIIPGETVSDGVAFVYNFFFPMSGCSNQVKQRMSHGV